MCAAMQVVSYGFAEKYSSGGVIGVLASDRVQLGDLMGASCAGVLVCHTHSALQVDHV